MSAETIDYTAPPVPLRPFPAPPSPVYVPIQLCGCGHERDAHEHHRPGADCGVCGPVRCRRYRRRTGRAARSSFRRAIRG